ncbi:unnamed protein product [Urochloa humidicola]
MMMAQMISSTRGMARESSKGNDDGTDNLRCERGRKGVFLLQPEKHVKQVLVFKASKSRGTLFLFSLQDDAAD